MRPSPCFVVGESIGDNRKREHYDPTPPSSNAGDVGNRVDGGNTDDDIIGDEWADTAAVLPKTKPVDAVQPSAPVFAGCLEVFCQQSFAKAPAEPERKAGREQKSESGDEEPNPTLLGPETCFQQRLAAPYHEYTIVDDHRL